MTRTDPTAERTRSAGRLLVSAFALVCALLLLPLAGTTAARSDVPALAKAASKPVLIPDKFLRRWDPVTVFFNRDIGPAAGGPEDRPQRLVTFVPDHPGAFTWLDARTLQFRPAEPWPALARFTWKVEGASFSLDTLMSSPTTTHPAQGADGLPALEEITLTFPEPLEIAALARMTTVELRPLPGVGDGPARLLTQSDFTLKAMPRPTREAPASYVLTLREPIPLGVRTTLKLRLTLDREAESATREISFATAEPFRLLGLGCRTRQLPLTLEGSRYSRDQAIDCGIGQRSVIVEFSSAPAPLGPVEIRNLVRFAPAVDGLAFDLQGRTLEIKGAFAHETLYSVRVVPAPVTDQVGRRLEIRGTSEVFLQFPRKSDFARFTSGQGVVELAGPQVIPVEARGQERVDLRIHRIEPLDRSLWPFPDRPVSLDESVRPPGPGETPGPPSEIAPPPSVTDLTKRLHILGSPPVSALVPIPLRRGSGAATFGLDLTAHLARLAGLGQPGTYLVGLRDLAAGSSRQWMRIQVTDLSLSTVEEPHATRFVVTSLSTGAAVPGATVRVEGVEQDRSHPARWVTFAEGLTDVDGAFLWPAPGYDPNLSRTIRRIVAQKADDVLILDPSRPPHRYADNQWTQDRSTWLQWVFSVLSGRGPQREELCHIFTERPVYRPEEEVHIKGYLRERFRGHLTPLMQQGVVVVEGPGDLAWRYPVTVTSAGSFYHRFQEKDPPTGIYRAHFEDPKGRRPAGQVSFRIEAYRVPRFEVNLHGPETATLDESFDVSLTATYYAGGKVGGQPVHWRVTQFPYSWTPRKLEGFLYSSDSRFSGAARFEATPSIEKTDTTNETGAARLALNPTIERTAQPRTYVVEATVTGPDDQTVTATRSFPALPPFVLGLKAPRFVERARQITPEIVVVGPSGVLLAGREVTVRLLRREWHSQLKASDFSDGVARYLTDVVDKKILEKKVTSLDKPLALALPIERSGVYIVEIEARDRLDRAQTVSVDLYAGGDEPVTWPKPVAEVFSVGTDKPRYDPGATAALVLKSPFQTARALAIVEAPEGNRYQWIDVRGGAAQFRLPILGTWAPRVPVHFVLMRGRLPGTAPEPGNATDLGKPATLAATAWLDVNPTAHQLTVKMVHPESARPGQKIDVTLSLQDPQGKPLAGEVTLWLVDQAVLALGKEQRLDPLPDFVTAVQSHLSMHDTRNMPFGALPLAELPGGDSGGEEESSLLDRATVRKNFKSVPYFNPAIPVGPDGKVTVTVQLSDDLTNFKLRAKATSGPERFGYATGHLPVRLPVIVQPALPRFARPGDSFTAMAIGRLVEGKGGPGAAEIRATGARLTGPARQTLTWVEGRPERIGFRVEIPTPSYTPEGTLATTEVSFRMGVERTTDGASDAFEVNLPLRPDREPVSLRALSDLVPGVPWPIPALAEAVRPGTLTRSLLVSDQPALIRMASGLDFLLRYPYGCTEQQVSRARAYVALRQFRSLLHQKGSDQEVTRAVKQTLELLPTTVDGNGLVAYWPGSTGTVSLTAWVVQFLVEAREAGFPVDQQLLDRLLRSLEQALRSDYSRFVDGESYMERAWALAALAQAGRFDSAYAAELSRRAQYLDLESVAEVVQAFGRAGQGGAAVDELIKTLSDGLIVRLHQGRETYGGLQEGARNRSGLVLPTETRTVAEITRALARVQPKHARLPIVTAALVTLGRDDGWGTTNANAAALLALSELLKPPFAGTVARSLRLSLDGREQTLALGPTAPLAFAQGSTAQAGQVVAPVGNGSPLVARLETRYVPAADGSQVASRSTGFVVTREIQKVDTTGAPPDRIALDRAGSTQTFTVGQVVEDHVQVVNPKSRHYVAVVVPLAAGMEPLNPRLATAPPEARPAGRLTAEPTYSAYLDDHVAFYFNSLPAGTYDFYFRTRATIPGSFIQPPAKAEMMYDAAVVGNGSGARIVIVPAEK